MAGNFGFATILIADATAAFDRVGVDGTRFNAQLVHDVTLASLNGEFATVLTTQDVMDSLNVDTQ